MLGCPFDAPAIDDDAAQQEQAALHRVRHLIDWAPYLGKLGVGAILLNPVFSSDTHGYNTRDMLTIDCRLGTNEDFKETGTRCTPAGCAWFWTRYSTTWDAAFGPFETCGKRWESPYKDWFNIGFDGDTHYGDGFWYEGWEGNQDLVN